MRFLDKVKKTMENYFLNTPVYKVWIDVITLLSARSCIFINELGFAFLEIKCKKEGVVETYSKGLTTLQLEFSHENRCFFVDYKF